jgi:hypothetical protein
MDDQQMQDVLKSFDMDTSKHDPTGERTQQALKNARQAIQDPHVRNLIALTLKIDSMTDEELRAVGSQMRGEVPSEGESTVMI